MKRTFAYGAATNQGNWPTQEDGFFVDPGAGLFALADGFGGRGNGDIAAKTALLKCRAPAGERLPRDGGIYTPAQAWHRDLFGEINKNILGWNEKRAPAARGGCSLIVASVEREKELVVTGCGACSAFLLRQGNWLSLLSPQSPPRAQPGDALFPSQALGVGRELNPETRSLIWQPGDILFLFSSGLAWEREAYLAELAGQAVLRAPGTDLAAVAALAADAGMGEGAPWNQTALVVEALL